GDYLEFYGLALDTPTTDTKVYWLTAGAGLGKRIKVVGSQANAATTAAQSFPLTVERKERVVYFGGLLNGEAENFFGQVIYSNPVTQVLNVHHPDQGATGLARLEVALQGATLQSHHVKVMLNE